MNYEKKNRMLINLNSATKSILYLDFRQSAFYEDIITFRSKDVEKCYFLKRTNLITHLFLKTKSIKKLFCDIYYLQTSTLMKKNI